MSFASRFSSLIRTAAGSPTARRIGRDLTRAAVRAVKDGRRGSGSGSTGAGRSSIAARSGGGAGTAAREGGAEGVLRDRSAERPVGIEYAPHRDDRPDPGEIVWAWVPYEEDISRGKDRPVLVLALEDAADGSGEVAVALMLTSRDRADSGAVVTDEHGSTWVDIGSGDWDNRGRPSEVRADRLLRIPSDAVRREGARLDRARFDTVADAVRDVHGW